MLELFHLPESICSQKVRLALQEKNLKWKQHLVQLSKWEHTTPEYLALNPNGVIPTLVHNGRTIIESTVICEYLDEVFPKPRLSPVTAWERANMRAWLRFIDEIPSMAIRIPSFNDVLLPRYRQMPREQFDAAINRMTTRQGFFKRMGFDGFPPEDYDEAIRQIRMTTERVRIALDDLGGPWLMGQQITCADLCLGPVLHRMSELGLLDEQDNDSLAAQTLLERLIARPSWSRAFTVGSNLL